MPQFSVFTPTHNTRWLGDCYESLVAQAVADWEWVVLLNGALPGPVPAAALADPRVRVLKAPPALAGIGALKAAAASACGGAILVELDHDDRLAPGCLAALGRAATERPGGFYYSDFVNEFDNGAPETFASDHGWERYEAVVAGRPRLCQRAFPPTPRSLCELWYAPNHVRAWAREAYAAAGGHDPAMAVGDDHDLVCRTYLAGAPFVHVPEPLYLYRRVVETRARNTYADALAAIAEASGRNTDRYLHALVAEWCRRERLPRLDLGGAHGCPPGFTAVDAALPRTDLPALGRRLRDHRGADWPDQVGGDALELLRELPADSVGCLRAVDFVEHLPRADMVPFMNEAYRVLAPDGFLLTLTPSSDGRGAFQDPTHTNFVNENSFWYYTDREYAKYLNGAVACRFQAVRLRTEFPSEWHRHRQVPYVVADLAAVKGLRAVGPVLI